MKTKAERTPEMKALLRQAGSPRRSEALAAQRILAAAVQGPLREGVLKGDIVTAMFNQVDFDYGRHYEWPLSFLEPGTERYHVAYVVPNWGDIPMRTVNGEYVSIPTYRVASSIDMTRQYARDADWNVLDRALEVLEASFIRKANVDGWRVLLAAANNRNAQIYDSAATGGFFSKRLVSLMITEMRRRAGGNSASLNAGKLTDLYMSPEALEDIRSWTLDEIDDVTRREIYLADGGATNEVAQSRIFGINLHVIDELGVNQEFQLYYQNVLNAGVASPMASGKQEIILGIDAANGMKDAFINPIREQVQIFEDDNLHRKGMIGWYGEAENGWACCDQRRVLLGNC